MDVMIDLETLDTAPSSVILSIGAVSFDACNPDIPMQTFHVKVNIDSQLATRTVSGRTIEWWIDQDIMARKKILEGPKLPLDLALEELARFVNDEDRVWGNGANFDITILEDAYRNSPFETPWKYYNVMCYRTVKNIYKNVPKPNIERVEHDALSDAIVQAKHLQAICAQMSSVKMAA